MILTLNDIDLVVSDLDGTLLDQHSKVAPTTAQAIQRVVTAGVPFAIASGRSHFSVNQIMTEQVQTTGYKVCLNGSLVFDPTGKLLVSQPIKQDIVDQIFNTLPTEIERVSVSGLNQAISFVPGQYAGKMYLPIDRQSDEINDWNGFKRLVQQKNENFKLGIRFHQADDIPVFIDQIRHLPVTVAWSDDQYVEITDQGISKLSALKQVSDIEQFSIDRFLCFGDQANDLEMLTGVGYSVAMGNATDPVKTIARYQTKTNQDNGVAEFLNQLA